MTWTSDCGTVRLYCGDCLDVLPTLEAGSVDAVVTDPPYGLSFMGKHWDHGIPGEQFWREVIRVAKPGCHLLAFGGTRTYHRLAVAIEDAGWEVRDCLGWIYGSGFPKSLDVSKAIDKAAGAEREVVGQCKRTGKEAGTYGAMAGDNLLTAPATDAAKQWQGWGTALKPAWEPIILARKPLVGTVAANVLEHGTGGLNVDGCRVGTSDSLGRPYGGDNEIYGTYSMVRGTRTGDGLTGRWPANIVHDGSGEVLGLFPDNRPSGGSTTRSSSRDCYSGAWDECERKTYTDSGTAARFFYCAKASKADRDEGCEGLDAKSRLEDVGNKWTTVDYRDGHSRNVMARNHHPTVKPTDLMRWLVRLVTPPDGAVLDPFMGSGSTGKAARLEGFQFIGIEREAEYHEIAKRRIEAAASKRRLFDKPS